MHFQDLIISGFSFKIYEIEEKYSGKFLRDSNYISFKINLFLEILEIFFKLKKVLWKILNKLKLHILFDKLFPGIF